MDKNKKGTKDGNKPVASSKEETGKGMQDNKATNHKPDSKMVSAPKLNEKKTSGTHLK